MEKPKFKRKQLTRSEKKGLNILLPDLKKLSQIRNNSNPNKNESSK